VKYALRPILSRILILAASISSAQEKETKIVKDFNSDGVNDTLRWKYDGGSGFGGNYYTLVNGKNKEKFELNTWGCFCTSWITVPIPPALLKAQNKTFLNALKKQMLPHARKIPDPSLLWIFKAISSRDTSRTKYFDLGFKMPLLWVSDTSNFQEHYALELGSQDFYKYYYSDGESLDPAELKKTSGWLIFNGYYYGVSRKNLKPVDSSGTIKVFTTPHAVILKKENKFAYAFVTDNRTTGAPDKLRWNSIKTAKLAGNYLIIHRSVPGDVYILNIESGALARLKIDDFIKNVIIGSHQLDIRGDKEYKSFTMSELFSELDKM
jgi:hypothetical protein